MSDPTNPSPSDLPPSPSPEPVIPPPTMDYAPPTATGGLFTAPITPSVIEMDANARTWGMIAHLSGLAGCLIPFGNIIGPLVVWQMKQTEIPFAGDQAKEALNFHITASILLVICLALMCVVIGFFLLPIVGIGALVFTIIGAIKANQGVWYRYPFAIRFVK